MMVWKEGFQDDRRTSDVSEVQGTGVRTRGETPRVLVPTSREGFDELEGVAVTRPAVE